jgi:L-aminopeptidase/D-esterase-like protein
MKGLTDIEGIRVGHASDYDALTGCTAILCEGGAVGGVDIRGSATGTQEMDTLSPGNVTDHVHAVVLAGGSAFGLEAASGVRRYLEHRGVGFRMGSHVVPIVPCAILYDLGIGKGNVRPTREMGEAAAAAASAEAVKEGAVGAGTGATVGKFFGMRRAMKSGVGTFTISLPDGVLVSALAAVNAVGDVRDPASGKLIAGARQVADSMELADTELQMRHGARRGGDDGRQNTTIAVVATNARLDKVGATKLAQQASLGMARVIYPVNTMMDGDLVVALSAGDLRCDVNVLGVAAAGALAEAIVRAVRHAPTLGGVPGLAGKP